MEEYLYSAFYILCISQSAQAWITQFYLQVHHACLSFVSVYQMAPPPTEVRIAAYYSSIDPEGMKSWPTFYHCATQPTSNHIVGNWILCCFTSLLEYMSTTGLTGPWLWWQPAFYNMVSTISFFININRYFAGYVSEYSFTFKANSNCVEFWLQLFGSWLWWWVGISLWMIQFCHL